MNAADLGQLLKEHPEMLDDGKKFAAILRDVYPSEKSNVNQMIIAYNAGVVSMLRKSDLDSLLTSRIMSLLMDDYGISEERARWAAELWADSYYFFQHGTLRKVDPPAANPAAPKPAPVQKPATVLTTPKPSPVQKPIAVPPTPKPTPTNSASAPEILKETDLSCFQIEKVSSGYCIKKYIGPNNGQVIIPAQIYGKPVTEIGDHAFSNYTALTAITIPKSVVEIGQGAFGGCRNLMNITLPDNIEVIGGWAFSNCTSLISITIPNRVTAIDVETFSGCTSMTNVTISNSVTEIHRLAFNGSNKLVIHASTGSYAETYARTNNILFEAIPKQNKKWWKWWD